MHSAPRAVEVLSPSSQRTGLVRKPEVLAKFGCCPNYWVVDPLRPADLIR